MDSATAATAAAPIERLPARSASPPQWWFHSLLTVAALVLLWSQSVPGDDFLWLMIGLAMSLVMGVIWLVRLILCLVGSGRPRWWLFVAPAMGVAVIALVIADVPLNARFELSRAEFDAAVAALPQDARRGNDTGRIGSYEITSWWRVPDGVILNDTNPSGITNDAGFAYLPKGPTPELANSNFENPEFTALGGDWYAWTASW